MTQIAFDVRMNTRDIFELHNKIDRDVVYPFFARLEGLSQRTSLIRLAAPVVGVFYGSMTFIGIIAIVFESIIKGSINVSLGALSLNKSLAKRGVIQIVIGGGFFALWCIPDTIYRTVTLTVLTLINPVGTFSSECESLRRELRSSSAEGYGSPSHFSFRYA